MAYTEQTWVDSPSTTTPISAARLLHMEQGIGDAHDAVAALEQAAAESGSVHRNLHNGTSYAARPNVTIVPAGYEEYVGPDEPTDALAGDTWVKTA